MRMMVGNEVFQICCAPALEVIPQKIPIWNPEISLSLLGGGELIGFALEVWIVLDAGEIPDGLEVTPLVVPVILG